MKRVRTQADAAPTFPMRIQKKHVVTLCRLLRVVPLLPLLLSVGQENRKQMGKVHFKVRKTHTFHSAPLCPVATLFMDVLKM